MVEDPDLVSELELAEVPLGLLVLRKRIIKIIFLLLFLCFFLLGKQKLPQILVKILNIYNLKLPNIFFTHVYKPLC